MHRVETTNDATSCRDRVWPYLIARECENCVPIGLLTRILEGKRIILLPDAPPPVFFLVTDEDGGLAQFAMQTPPQALLLTRASANATCELASHLARAGWAGPVNAPTPTINDFITTYSRLTERQFDLKVRLRVFELTQVIDPSPSPGSMRVATLDDLDLAIRWRAEFAREVDMPHAQDEAAAARRSVEEQCTFFWVDDLGQSVSFAGCGGPTPNGMRIGPVYTPAEHRGRGYASNLVAALSRHLLQSGIRFCFLFTDLANPTSNSIYQKIGYRPVSDFERWELIET